MIDGVRDEAGTVTRRARLRAPEARPRAHGGVGAHPASAIRRNGLRSRSDIERSVARSTLLLWDLAND
jgi:hypothetical protein